MAQYEKTIIDGNEYTVFCECCPVCGEYVEICLETKEVLIGSICVHQKTTALFFGIEARIVPIIPPKLREKAYSLGMTNADLLQYHFNPCHPLSQGEIKEKAGRRRPGSCLL